MPLLAPALKKKIEAVVLSAFQKEFKKEYDADPTTYKRMAKVISEVAEPIVSAITTEAQVMPGISSVGTSPTGPTTGATITPGKVT